MGSMMSTSTTTHRLNPSLVKLLLLPPAPPRVGKLDMVSQRTMPWNRRARPPRGPELMIRRCSVAGLVLFVGQAAAARPERVLRPAPRFPRCLRLGLPASSQIAGKRINPRTCRPSTRVGCLVTWLSRPRSTPPSRKPRATMPTTTVCWTRPDGRRPRLP